MRLLQIACDFWYLILQIIVYIYSPSDDSSVFIASYISMMVSGLNRCDKLYSRVPKSSILEQCSTMSFHILNGILTTIRVLMPGFSNAGSRPKWGGSAISWGSQQSFGVAGSLGSRAMLKNNVWSIIVRILHVQHGYGKYCTILMTFGYFFIFIISVSGR